MIQLKTNERIRLNDGREATVLDFLGEGAQGAVYTVMVNGEPKALKWFRRTPEERFLQNLKKNIADGSPSHIFLWPEGMTHVKYGGQGYIMPLKPKGSYEFTKFRLAKVRFRSFGAIMKAAISLCEAFRLLHAQGLSYQDLNDGGFFINPDTGEVAICDCDNVYPHGENSGILGKARFMAPEVVMGKTLPNSYTDRFSLSVILFMLFCIDHPFEGSNVVKRPCMTEEIEQKLFGRDLCFIFDKDNNTNRPVRGIHSNVLTMWPLLPNELKNTFIKQFSRDTLDNPENRMTEMQWVDILISVRDKLMRCPRCGDETFVENGKTCLNPRCRATLTVSLTLDGSGRSIPLIKGNKIKLDKTLEPSAFVVEKPGAPGNLLIKNVMTNTWNVMTPSGKSIQVVSGGFMPVKEGLSINTGSLKLKINKINS